MPQAKARLGSSTVPARPSSGNGNSGEDANTDRMAAVEATLVTIQHTLDVQFKRIAAMQAEIDRLTAK